jgi:hypothetical protein
MCEPICGVRDEVGLVVKLFVDSATWSTRLNSTQSLRSINPAKTLSPLSHVVIRRRTVIGITRFV